MKSSIPFLLYADRHNSMIGRVSMYCATVFWQWMIYTPIPYSPTVASAAPMGGYTHALFNRCLSPMPAIFRTAWWSNTARTSLTQTRALLGPPPHRIFPPFSYLTLISPISLLSVPTFPAPISYSAPLLSSRCLWTI